MAKTKSLTIFVSLHVFCTVAIAGLCAQGDEPLRMWRDDSGRTVSAKLIKAGQDTIQLVKEDGKVINVPVVRLSEPDREYLKSRKVSAGATTADPKGKSRKPHALRTAPTKEDAEHAAMRIRKIVAAIPANAKLNAALAGQLTRIYASVGDEEAALRARDPNGRDQPENILAAVQRGQLRSGQNAAAKITAEKLLAMLDAIPAADRKTEFRSIQILAFAAAASARVRDYESIKRVMAHRVAANDALRNQIQGEVLGVQCEIGDVQGAYATAISIPVPQRFHAISSLIKSQRQTPDPIPAELYTQILKAIPADRDSIARELTIQVLAGLCRHGRYNEAAEYVVSINPTHTDRQSLLTSVVKLQAKRGDVDGAIKSATRAGYLVLAATFQIESGKVDDGIKSLHSVLASLEPVALRAQPADQLQTDDQVAPVMDRIRLLRAIAVLLFRAGKADEGRRAIEMARPLVEHASRERQAYLVQNLDSAELDAAAAMVSIDRIDVAIATVRKYSDVDHIAEAVARLWTQIGVTQWQSGRQAEARVSFQNAIDAAAGEVSGKKTFKFNLGELSAARARTGDVRGAVETLALEKSEVDDKLLGIIAVAKARGGDIAGALSTIERIRPNTQRHATLLSRIAEVQAEKGDWDGAFHTYFENMRSVGESNVPSDLILSAVDKGHIDLVLRHFKIRDSDEIARLARALNEAGQEVATQRMLERALEVEMAKEAKYFIGSNNVPNILNLMATEGDASRIKALLPPVTDLRLSPRVLVSLYARFGDLDVAIQLAKAARNANETEHMVQAAMGAITLSIVPFGEFYGERLARNNSPTRLPDVFDMTFTEEFNLFDKVVEPHISVEAAQRVAAKAQAPPQVAVAVPTNNAWSVTTVYEGISGNAGSSPSQLAVAFVNDQPIALAIASIRPHGWTVIAAQPTAQKWKWEIIAQPEGNESYWAVDAVTANKRVYVALNSAKGDSERSGSLSIRALADGKWTTEFNSRDRGAHYGGGVRLGVVADTPIAVLTGRYAASGGASHSAHVLDRALDGKWTESKLPVPYNAGIISFSLAGLNDEPVVAICTAGGTGMFFGHRQGGTWKVSNFTKQPAYESQLVSVDGSLALIARRESVDFWTYKRIQWEQRPLTLPANANIRSMHAAVISGKPMLACFDQAAFKLHLMSYEMGAWSDRIIPTKLPINGMSALRLFEWKGEVAIMALGNTQDSESLLVIRPLGAASK